nr:hypothetical protein [Candidatus Cloacimonadota bacterium]
MPDILILLTLLLSVELARIQYYTAIIAQALV